MTEYGTPEVKKDTAFAAPVPSDTPFRLVDPSVVDGLTPFLCAYHGRSMSPVLDHCDLLEVAPYGQEAPRVGDVVFLVIEGAPRHVVHRVIASSASGIRTRGDNRSRPDKWCLGKEAVKGRVVAVWRGSRRRRVAGGPAGRIRARLSYCFRALDRGMSPAISPLYSWLCRSGVLKAMLPARLRPRRVVFRSKKGDQERLFMGRRVIGHYDHDRRCWAIRRPFRLFVGDVCQPSTEDPGPKA